MSEKKRRRRRRRRLPDDLVKVTIEALSSEGRGIAHVDERPVFIDYALEGEEVEFKYTHLTSKIAEGKAVNIIKASDDRVEPTCSVFTVCGGCSLQHMQHDKQLEHKQNTLIDLLQRVGQVNVERILPPVTGPIYNYRHKARLGIRYVEKKQRTLVGFRERHHAYLTDTRSCPVLHSSVGERIEALSECINSLEQRTKIAQAEIAVGETHTVVVLRNLAELPDCDRQKLIAFAKTYQFHIMLQPGSPDALENLWPETSEQLYYLIPDYEIKIEFSASDFTQVNPEINLKMINQAIELLQLKPEDNVLDLFCGLGNFTLPLARHCERVTAVEGVETMVRKARENARRNQLENIEFICSDLYSSQVRSAPWLNQCYDKILLDPPRSGAGDFLREIKRFKAKRIVYVSCHPATLARDANVLVNEFGYKLEAAGILDMFPHTAHVEAMAVFDAC